LQIIAIVLRVALPGTIPSQNLQAAKLNEFGESNKVNLVRHVSINWYLYYCRSIFRYALHTCIAFLVLIASLLNA